MPWLDAFRHWLAVWTGTVNEPGPQYGFFSGFGGDVAIIGALLAAPIVLLRKHNCPVRRCWRIGRLSVDGTGFVVCAAHHPVGKPTHAHILAAHRAHRQRLTAAGKDAP